jgi:geranylgeranyl pyrophosphate synthase
VAATGAPDEARRRALEHVDEAKEVLDGAPVSPEQRRALALVADGVVERYA